MNNNLTLPVERQLAAYNKGDIDAYMANFAEDCVVEDGLGNVTMRGAEEMRDRYAKLFATYPNQHCEILSRTVVGNWVLDEERITGRVEGEETRCVAVYLVEDGLIRHIRFLR